jgi:hypothetical protein
VYCLPIPPLQKQACLLRKNFEGHSIVWYVDILLIVIKFNYLAARKARRQCKTLSIYKQKRNPAPLRAIFILVCENTFPIK